MNARVDATPNRSTFNNTNQSKKPDPNAGGRRRNLWKKRKKPVEEPTDLTVGVDLMGAHSKSGVSKALIILQLFFLNLNLNGNHIPFTAPFHFSVIHFFLHSPVTKSPPLIQTLCSLRILILIHISTLTPLSPSHPNLAEICTTTSLCTRRNGSPNRPPTQ